MMYDEYDKKMNPIKTRREPITTSELDVAIKHIENKIKETNDYLNKQKSERENYLTNEQSYIIWMIILMFWMGAWALVVISHFS